MAVPPPPVAVLAGRVLLLLAAAGAVVIAMAGGRGADIGVDDAPLGYACPMHRHVTSPAPGKCPICGMALERETGRTPAGAPVQEAADLRPYAVNAARPHTFTQAVRAPAWREAPELVSALLYKDELVGLEEGQAAKFVASGQPGVETPVQMEAGAPEPWDGATIRVRFRMAPGAETQSLGPREPGWVVVPARARQLLVVPYAAVIESAEGPSVFVSTSRENRTFSRRRVELGRVFFGLAVVLSGLADGEQVAIGNPFFLNAEQRLRAQPEALAAHAGPHP